MKVSWSGVAVLLLLVLGGPLFYLGAFVVRRARRLGRGGESYAKPEAEADAGANGDPGDGSEGASARETWSSTQYLFGLIGYAIGIGNVWRFCYVIGRDGGLASLLAYMLSFVFIATPLFLFEMVLGQWLRVSALPAWIQVRPRWAGLGYSQFLLCFIVQSYFCMIIAYTLPYILGSCADPLPWEGNSEAYWFIDVLGLKQESAEDGSLEDSNRSGIHWPLLVSYVVIWLVVYCSISFGKEMLAKITYVTVVAPCVLVMILVVRTAVLPGAAEGIQYYIGKFETSKLLDLQVWASALSQCLFSLSPGFGTAITMSSHTKPGEDVYKAALITSAANTLFALIAGFAVFAMVGNIAAAEGVEVGEIASRGGTGLAFIVIASAMPTFGRAANAMSVMFFFMLLTLGLDSAFAWSETLTAAVEDMLTKMNFRRRPTWLVSAILCLVNFAVGLPYTTFVGSQFLESIDNFVGSNFLLFVCFLESAALILDVGFPRLDQALRQATGGRRSIYPKHGCRFGFYLAIPVATLGLFLYQLYYNGANRVVDSRGIEICGWVLMGVCVGISLFGLWRREEGALPAPGGEGGEGEGVELMSGSVNSSVVAVSLGGGGERAG